MADLRNKTYYKFQKLEKFERFIEIVANKRLYGAVYNELNDPMEGKFHWSGSDKDELKNIYDQLKATRVCSLLTKQEKQIFPNNFLMWSHYADSHKGCCFELQITGMYNGGWDLYEVKYDDKIPIVNGGDIHDIIKNILSVKHSIWKDEHEVRAMKIYDKKKFSSLSEYYHVIIKAIYFGDKVKREKVDFYKKIITSIDDSINIFWIREEKGFTGNFPKLTYKKM